MRVKILSWNIWVDCKFEKTKDFLIQSQADIIGLQEVREDDPSRETIKLLTSLGYQYSFSPCTKTWGGKDWTYGPAIFTKYKHVSPPQHKLSKDVNKTVAHADVKIGDKIIHLFSAHLSHTHQQESILQLNQAKQLLKIIPRENSILMGDFNALPTSQTIHLVKEQLVDADNLDQPTWSVYPEGCVVCKPQKIESRLDYIFTTRDISIHSYQVERSHASDHLPISALAEI